jgi:hypothetical protein
VPFQQNSKEVYAMSEVKILGNIDTSTEIWRYLTIEKLIDIFENKRLYFTPLHEYSKTDPFEGYLPFVAMEAHAKIYKKQYDELKSFFKKMELDKPKTQLNPTALALYEKAKIKFKEYELHPSRIFNSITRDIRVNCWHMNVHESDAMWRLYSKKDNGIAIKTTIKDVIDSLEIDNEEIPVQIGKVKYMDFFDKELEPKDCLTESGNLSPLLKRVSFQHEQELRLFIVPRKDITGCILPEFIRVDPSTMIKKIITSPSSNILHSNAVRIICKKYGIKNDVVEQSGLVARFKEYKDVFNAE